MKTFNKFLYLLSTHEIKRAGLLFLMILTMALLDMIGVASILPFMAVLVNPDIIETNIILKMFIIFRIFLVLKTNNNSFLL